LKLRSLDIAARHCQTRSRCYSSAIASGLLGHERRAASRPSPEKFSNHTSTQTLANVFQYVVRHMIDTYQIELERLGLSAVEAQIYLALLSKSGNWRATALVAMMHIPRSTVYLALTALLNKGLVEAEAGYGGRFSAVPPGRALKSLIA